ncbi:MAG: hypothetical protein R3F65_05105 [bacterium]
MADPTVTDVDASIDLAVIRGFEVTVGETLIAGCALAATHDALGHSPCIIAWADVPAAAAVLAVVRSQGFAAILCDAVAVEVAGITREKIALAAFASHLRVRTVAWAAAGPAVFEGCIELDFTAIIRASVAVGEASEAVPEAADTLPAEDLDVGRPLAHKATPAAVVGVGGDRRLTAILIVAIAVAEAHLAGGCAADTADAVGGATSGSRLACVATSAAVEAVEVGGDLTAVLRAPVAIAEARHAARDHTLAGDAGAVGPRQLALDAATTAVVRAAQRVGLTAVAEVAVAVLEAFTAVVDRTATVDAGRLRVGSLRRTVILAPPTALGGAEGCLASVGRVCVTVGEPILTSAATGEASFARGAIDAAASTVSGR